jgi:hypothetical protein
VYCPWLFKARIQSGQGRATVYLDEMRLSNVSARNVVLDFLVENFLLPFYPTAAIMRSAACFPIRAQSGTPMPV